MKTEKVSLLCPMGVTPKYRQLSESAYHDLGMDRILEEVTGNKAEQNQMTRILIRMTDDVRVASYRADVFEDIFLHPQAVSELLQTLDQISFIRDYGSYKKEAGDVASTWDMIHRLEELRDYIGCVEALKSCLDRMDLSSEGMLTLRRHIDALYEDRAFAEMKQDIMALKATTSDLKSVTLGVNLNDRFEADGIGLISINNKYFTKSNILGSFMDKISGGDKIKEGTEWRDDYHFQPFTATEETASAALQRAARRQLSVMSPWHAMTMASVPEGDEGREITHYMDRVTNHLLSMTARKLRDTLNKYLFVTVTEMTDLIPELIYYVRWAAYIRKLQTQDYPICKPAVCTEDEKKGWMQAEGFYNLKLIGAGLRPDEIVGNNLDFDEQNRVYVLTGANRGGKTTLTQALGQLFVLAQGGIYVQAKHFEFCPADCIYTHFPADEDKTMNLGRLGEECSRFRQMFYGCSESSLLLLNETFATTSFDEAYFIAMDCVKAILKKGVRTLYNTHMHKLAMDLTQLPAADGAEGAVVSIVMKTEDGKRSFRLAKEAPEGLSYAKDIAEKYGVTFEMLTEDDAV